MITTSSQSPRDRIMWMITEHGGSMTKGDLARRLNMKIGELDLHLKELERAGKINLTEIKGKLAIGLRRGE